MKVKLVVVEGAKPTQMFLKLPTIIGRSSDAKIKLRHSIVSREHCKLYESDQKIIVRDLGSSNGTFVNDRRTEEPTVLNTNDLLRIGPVTLRAVVQNSEHADTEIIYDGSANRDVLCGTCDDSDVHADSASIANPSDGIDEDSQQSVLRVKETPEGSFVGIDEVDEPSDRKKMPRFDDSSSSKPRVSRDNSVLGNFLNNLE